MDNKTFLNVIFGDQAPNVHITDFLQDPLDIPQSQRFLCWMGGSADTYKTQEGTNQYFTISIFEKKDGKSRRQKALFKQTHVIVLDDVHEKIHESKAKLLPHPTYIIETSPGSEQWGYVLDEPCKSRQRVENLLDGLVANGLTQSGKDPGMKGVTRYVRLPEGYNTKKGKNAGKPYKCILKHIDIFSRVTMEDLAAPFGVELDATRREDMGTSASEMPDHPIFSVDIKIKNTLSAGRFDITCPWVDEHTDQSDSGTALFTNSDGSLGFKCHHGHCETKTMRDFLMKIDETVPGFSKRYEDWRMSFSFDEIVKNKPVNENVEPEKDPLTKLLRMIQMEPPNSAEARRLAEQYLKMVDGYSEIDRNYYHNEVSDVMRWTKTEFVRILKDLRETWYKRNNNPHEFYSDVLYIREQNRFFNTRSRIFFTTEGFHNSFADIDPEVRNQAIKGQVTKVDKLDFLPNAPLTFVKNDIVYGNSWAPKKHHRGKPGDVSLWLDHFDTLGWRKEKEHLLQWMAHTILVPEVKINHIIILGGQEGIGKDFLLYPLIEAMSPYSRVISGNELTSDFNDYLMSTKYLHVNETELGDHRKALEVSANLKPLAACPPETLRVNPKGISVIDIRNIVNVSMCTNSRTPVKLTGPSRRFFPLWSDLNPRDNRGQMTDEWLRFFHKAWEWMKNGGFEHCIHYLRNNVDLSTFRPGAAPIVTEFLEDMTEDSKSPMQQTIEAFIHNRVGAFGSDILTSDDACDTLKAGLMTADHMMYCDPHWFTPTKFGRIASCIHFCNKGRARKGDRDLRPWIIRNHNKYIGLSYTELYTEYERQIAKYKTV